jgi:flagellar biosynthesis anti-sigma factor FlgM
MVRDINGLGNFANQKTNAEPTTGKTAAKAQPTGAENTQAAPTDEVQLSDSAKSLRSLTSTVNQLPEINSARAEKIKAALESGEYSIDELVLANKIINSEKLLEN